MLDVHVGVHVTSLLGRGTSQSSVPRPGAKMSKSQEDHLETTRKIWVWSNNFSSMFRIRSTIGFRIFPSASAEAKSTQVEAHLTPQWTAEAPESDSSGVVSAQAVEWVSS